MPRLAVFLLLAGHFPPCPTPPPKHTTASQLARFNKLKNRASKQLGSGAILFALACRQFGIGRVGVNLRKGHFLWRIRLSLAKLSGQSIQIIERLR